MTHPGTHYLRLGDIRPGDWVKDALCAQTDPESFFPEKGGSTRAAKSVCRDCPVRAECLDWALSHNERFGIWGGLSERERARVGRDDIRRPHACPRPGCTDRFTSQHAVAAHLKTHASQEAS